MRKCTVCGKEFELKRNDRYTTRDDTSTGAFKSLADHEVAIYDTFDCPHCGCQNVVQRRKRMWPDEVLDLSGLELEEDETDDGDGTEEEPEEDDKPYCFGTHNAGDEDVMPCGHCRYDRECMEVSGSHNDESNKPDCFGKYNDDDEDLITCMSCQCQKKCEEAAKANVEDE